MKRVINAWPYALGVVGLFVLLWACTLFSWSCEEAGCFGLDPLDWKGLFLTMRLLVFPVLAFLGAAVLGLRRGYDWVTILTCLAVGLAFPEPQGSTFPWITSDSWINKDWFFLGIYVIVVHLGIATGLVVRALVRRVTRSAVPA